MISTLCPICQQRPPAWQEEFCSVCRRRTIGQIRRKLFIRTTWRMAVATLIEAGYGLVIGLTTLMSMGLAGGVFSLSQAGAILLFIAFILFVAVQLQTAVLKAWVDRAKPWARANLIGALTSCILIAFPAAMMLQAKGQIAHILFHLVIIAIEGPIGLLVPLWQQRLLDEGRQSRRQWLRNSLLGWFAGCYAHFLVGIMVSNLASALWFGTALCYLTYGLITHATLAWFDVRSRRASWQIGGPPL